MSSRGERDIPRYASIGLLVAGTALVLIAAIIAYSSFYGFTLPEVRGSTVEEAIISLVSNLVELASKLGFLGIMVWAGGVLLKYGIQLLRS